MAGDIILCHVGGDAGQDHVGKGSKLHKIHAGNIVLHTHEHTPCALGTLIVAVAGKPDTHEGRGLNTVEMVGAGLIQRDHMVAPVDADGLADGLYLLLHVVDLILVKLHLHTVGSVDYLHHIGVCNADIVVYLNTQIGLNTVDQKLGAAVVIGDGELGGVAVGLDHADVTHEGGEDNFPAGVVDGDDDHAVGVAGGIHAGAHVVVRTDNKDICDPVVIVGAENVEEALLLLITEHLDIELGGVVKEHAHGHGEHYQGDEKGPENDFFD